MGNRISFQRRHSFKNITEMDYLDDDIVIEGQPLETVSRPANMYSYPIMIIQCENCGHEIKI